MNNEFDVTIFCVSRCTAKNLVLAGPAHVCIFDPEGISEPDLGCSVRRRGAVGNPKCATIRLTARPTHSTFSKRQTLVNLVQQCWHQSLQPCTVVSKCQCYRATQSTRRLWNASMYRWTQYTVAAASFRCTPRSLLCHPSNTFADGGLY